MATTATKPTIVIVPGAMHVPEHWGPLLSKLEALSYPASCLALPEIGANARTSPEYDSANAIRKRLEHLVESDEKEVVVFFHSAGGNPGCQAIRGLERALRRREGKRGGVVSLVFIAAFLIPEGSTLVATAEGAQLPSWAEFDGNIRRPLPITGELFYSDLPKPEQEHWRSLLQPQALHGATSPVHNSCWGVDIPKLYILTTNDRVATVKWQEDMLSKVDDGTWRVERLHSDHSPFLSHPDDLVKLATASIPTSEA